MIPQQWAFRTVLALWAIMSGVVPGCVGLYGRNLPFKEDWLMVPALFGQLNFSEWLWARHGEHWLPLPKALYLLLLKVSGADFRIGMFANILVLAGLCLAMIFAARHIRGRKSSLADVFFPFVLLHLGHMENVMMGWQIIYTISTMMIGAWLIIIVRYVWPLPPKIVVGAGLLLLSAPFSGANGSLFTPFIASWLAVGTFLHRHEVQNRWIIKFAVGCIAVSIATMVIYFSGYVRQGGTDNPGVWPTVVTGVRVVGMTVGPVGAGKLAPKYVTGLVFCAATFLLLGSSILLLWHRLRQRTSSERSRIFGLLVFAAAMAALFLAVAWGRAAQVPIWGMPDRYALLAAPAPCAAYFTWLLYGPEEIRDRITIVFAITSLVALPFNMQEGYRWTRGYDQLMAELEQDISAGLSWQELIGKDKVFTYWITDGFVGYMQMLNEAKIGPFGRANPRQQ